MKSGELIRRIISVSIIVLASLLPVFYTWGRLKIGGDVMIPFDLTPISKYLYQWLAIQNGGYYVQNYLPLYLVYWLSSFLNLSIYQISGLIYFLINISAGIGIYKITFLISKKDVSLLSRLIPVIFYLFSPALLNGWQYLYFYGVLPWATHYIFKFILSGSITFLDLIWLQIIVFFGSLDLPNPKYLFYLFVFLMTVLCVSSYLKWTKFQTSRSILWKLLLFFALNSYLLLPLMYFSRHYQAIDYGIHTRSGYSDIGKMMDEGVSTVRQMFTLHHGANINEPQQLAYLSNPLATLTGYFVIFSLIFSNLIYRKRTPYYQIKLYLSASIAIFLFLAVGPNPPFGFIYEFMVTKIALLAFLRTTAGAVFVLSVLYSLSIYVLSLENTKYSKHFRIVSLICIVLIGYPIIFGNYYNNSSNTNKLANTLERGFVLPEEYLKVSDRLSSLRLDQKTFIPEVDSSYIHADWGYFGPPIYNFLYNNYPIYKDKIFSSLENHNVGVIYFDSHVSTKSATFTKNSDLVIVDSGAIKVVETDRSSFLPHFYLDSLNSKSEASIEFKKINSTKYRVLIHHISGKFKLNFLEQFNGGWLIYQKSLLKDKLNIDSTILLDKYKILQGNENDQANINEVTNYLSRGQISSLGSNEIKETIHYDWVNGQRQIVNKEDYQIDFVSKKLKNSIQNNNLDSGTFFETWALKPLTRLEHSVHNNYANSWEINTSDICEQNSSCLKNEDGTFELQFIVEFWPQRLFYFGAIISCSATVICVFLSFLLSRKIEKK